MTLSLRVDREPWRAGVRATAERYGDVIAVVKGSGYGFGRRELADEADHIGLHRLAVGTVHELAEVRRPGPPPLVLTPAFGRDVALGDGAILTVGSVEHVFAAAGRRDPVTVKLASSMRRYGVDPAGLPALLQAIDRAGLVVDGFALHLPLAGDVGEVDAWLPHLPGEATLTVSHLDPAALGALRARHPLRRLPIRLGTALWHSDRSTLALRADVIAVRRVAAGERAGYRPVEITGAGTLVMIGVGTAHGVHPLPDGRSPFHFARQRLALLEPPHMHTSMTWVPDGRPCPQVADEVDVQQALTFVTVDEVVAR